MRKLLFLLLLWPSVALAVPEAILNWVDNSTDELSFKIERTTAVDVPSCQTATGFSFLIATGANVTSYIDMTVLEGVTYCYRVRASNANGDSDPSNIVGISIPFECAEISPGIVLVKEPCGPIIH